MSALSSLVALNKGFQCGY